MVLNARQCFEHLKVLRDACRSGIVIICILQTRKLGRWERNPRPKVTPSVNQGSHVGTWGIRLQSRVLRSCACTHAVVAAGLGAQRKRPPVGGSRHTLGSRPERRGTQVCSRRYGDSRHDERLRCCFLPSARSALHARAHKLGNFL